MKKIQECIHMNNPLKTPFSIIKISGTIFNHTIYNKWSIKHERWYRVYKCPKCKSFYNKWNHTERGDLGCNGASWVKCLDCDQIHMMW